MSRPATRATTRLAGTGVVGRVRSGATAVGLWGRLVRAEPLIVGAVATIVATGALLLAGGSRLLDSVSTDDVRQSVADGLPIERSIVQELTTRIGAGPTDDPFARVDERGQRFLDESVPPSVAAVLGPRQFVVDSPPYRVGSFPDQEDGPFVLGFQFRYQQDVDEQLRLVDGVMPSAQDPVEVLFGPDCPADRLAVDGFETSPDVDCTPTRVPVQQVAVTAQTAEDLLMELGQRAILRPDLVAPAWAFAFDQLLSERIVIEISAIVELSGEDDDYWFGDTTLHRPVVTENADIRIVDAVGLLAPDAYRGLLRSGLEVGYDYRWRHPVIAERIGTDGAEALLTDLETIETLDGEIVTALPAVLDDHLRQRRLTIALLAIAFAGALTVAGAAVWVLTGLAVARQEPTWRLALERGLGRAAVVGAGAVGGLVVAVPAAALGLAVAVWLAPEAGSGRPVLLTVALATVVVVATIGATAAAVLSRSGPAGRVVRATVDGRGVRLRRLVRDGALVVAAAGATLLVLRRDGGDGLDDAGRLDLLVTLTPTVVGAAVVVVALRLAGPLMALAASAGARLAGPVAFLGLRRLVAGGRTARASIVVVVLAVGLAVLALSVRGSVADARVDGGWQAIGGDVDIRSRVAGAALEPDLVAGVDDLGTDVVRLVEFPSAAARVGLPPDGPTDDGNEVDPAVDPAVDVESIERTRLDVVAIETEAFLDLLAPADSSVLDRPALRTLIDGSGDDRGLAVVAVGTWPDRAPPAVGTPIRVELRGGDVDVVVTARTDELPGWTSPGPLLVADRDALAELRPGPLAPSSIRLGGPTMAADDLRAEVAEVSPWARIRIREELEAATERDPLARWTLRGLMVLAAAAIALGVAAALAGPGLTAPTRRRDLGLLTTLGLRRAQAAAITAIEQVTPIALAAAAGIGLGALLVAIVDSAMDLAPFVTPGPEFLGSVAGSGPDVDIALRPSPGALLATPLPVLVAALAASARAARTRPETARTPSPNGEPT